VKNATSKEISKEGFSQEGDKEGFSKEISKEGFSQEGDKEGFSKEISKEGFSQEGDKEGFSLVRCRAITKICYGSDNPLCHQAL
jgi:hypothetical protein